MRIKICGITNKEDANNAVSLGADALGFIFYPNSPRYIHPDIVEEIAMFLPPFILLVGVFVNQDINDIKRISNQCRLDLIQLHGEESTTTCLDIKKRVIKSIRVSEPDDLTIIPQYQGAVSAILLDTKVPGMPGGTGQTFDWGLALNAKDYDIPLILSGGINSNNIDKAITLVNPYAIDLSSGVEKEPGIKDYQKMQSVIEKVKQF